MKWKRTVIRIGVVLVLGAMVNIAVAWGLALWPYRLRGPLSSVEGVARGGQHYKVWMVQAGTRSDRASVTSSWHSSDESWFKLLTVAKPGDAAAVVPAWARPLAIPDRTSEDGVLIQRSANAYGWPMLSVLSSMESVYDSRTRVRTQSLIAGLRIAEPSARQHWSKSVLPIRPIWPGFAINTMMYAALAWMLCASGVWLKRRWNRRRAKRGLCAKCGYDLRGSESTACPECGAAKIVGENV